MAPYSFHYCRRLIQLVSFTGAALLFDSCGNSTTTELLDAKFLANAGKYFTVAAGSITSASGGGWSNGTQIFTVVYGNAALSPGASTQIGIKAQAAGDSSVSGNALKNLSMNSPTTSTIATVSSINLSTKTNCMLEYDIRFDIGNQELTSVEIFFGGNLLSRYKEPGVTSNGNVSSSGVFVPRKAFIGSNVTGNISIVTKVGGNTGNTGDDLDIWIDNLRVTCNHPTPSQVTLINSNFESSLAGWTNSPQVALTASQGNSSSTAPYANLGSAFNSTVYLTWGSNIDLLNNFGCKLKFWWRRSAVGANQHFNFMGVQRNASDLLYKNGDTSSGGDAHEISLVAYEGTSTNQLRFYCAEDSGTTAGIQCAFDEVEVTCQQ